MIWLDEIDRAMAAPDWDLLEAHFPNAAAMRACVQDPQHHAEGDVWTHTRLVYEGLERVGLGGDRIAALAALFHDIAKPQTRTEEPDETTGAIRIRHPNHAPWGAQDAWRELWRAGVDVQTRLQVYHLIFWHQRVFFMFDYKNMDKRALEYACLAPWSRLVRFGRADIGGRIKTVPDDTLEMLDLLELHLTEMGIWDAAPDWSDAARIFFFEKEGRSPHFEPQEPKGSRVVVMSGLPGSGKDTHIARHLPDHAVVSLDGLRDELGIDPRATQGRVVQAAKERAREHLRAKRPFVWNATNLTKELRGQLIKLFREYDAHVTIHAIDRPLATILRQNRERERVVPEQVILDLARKWDPPTPLEAHEVVWY